MDWGGEERLSPPLPNLHSLPFKGFHVYWIPVHDIPFSVPLPRITASRVLSLAKNLRGLLVWGLRERPMLIEICRPITLPPYTPENDRLDVAEGTTASEAMHIPNIRPAETLILVNGIHAGPGRILDGGDRLAFAPAAEAANLWIPLCLILSPAGETASGSTSMTRSAPKNPYVFRGPEAAAARGRGPTTLSRW